MPIVMLTSRAGEKHREKAFELGATDYLVKPFQQDQLLDTLHWAVEQSRA
jgi:chemosensory pili system protein ChpA (sensor histidine kinase/response regulator)